MAIKYNKSQKNKTGYKHVGSFSDSKLTGFFKAYTKAVAKRVEEAERKEAKAIAKHKDIVFNCSLS